MEDQTRYRTKGTQKKTPQFIEPGATPPSFQARVAQPEMTPAPSNEGLWQRIQLAPGVELHLRKPLDPRIESLVQQIINYASMIFQNKPQGGTK
jgi:hypothetical protein